MKKVIINIVLILIFIIIYLLQINVLNYVHIAGVKPNPFIIYILYIGLFMGRKMGLSYGIVFGIILDLLVGRKVGITAIMLGAIGLLAGVFEKNFSKDSRITIILMVIGSTIIYEIGIYFLSYMLIGTTLEIISFCKILIAEIVYNALLTIIVYPLIQKSGYNVEEVFKGNKILTRYF